jgi:energy-coupling factor transporter ATP-binding protein EcfA2
MTNGVKYEGFKLISLELKNNNLIGKKQVRYEFIENSDQQDSIYTTVIIGANGTGKSNLFRILIELLKDLNDLANLEKRNYNVTGEFVLKFSYDNDIYEYGNLESTGNEILNQKVKAFLKKNDKPLLFPEVKLPTTIVANAIMLTDKYPFYRKYKNNNNVEVDPFPQYKYLGVRNISSTANTRAYIRKTVDFIVAEIDNTRFIDGLKKTTSFLGLANGINVYYYTSNTVSFFRGELTPDILDNYFSKIQEKYSQSTTIPPFKLQQYLKIKESINTVQVICDFCNDLFRKDKLEKIEKTASRKISYNIINQTDFKELKESYQKLEQLRQLGMLSAPDIELKREGNYALHESSSGEYHLFSSIVGLLATVKPYSLVFIDEPEISLHPNWQMQYLSFLRELFSGDEYKSTHILVATHSHFLISDLKGENSKIIGLKRGVEGVKIIEMPLNLNTYGWSAEDVLYRIFNVKSDRNHYYEMAVAELLSLLHTESKEIERIRIIIDDLRKLEVSVNDPLNELLIDAESYLKNDK